MKNESRLPIIDAPVSIGLSEKRELLGEREGKSLYHSVKPDLLIQEFTHSGITDPKNHSSAKAISTLRNEISSYLFEYIERFHIPTHFISKLSATEMAVKRLQMMPFTVRVYNVVSGPLVKRFGLKEGRPLDFPVIEHYYQTGKKTPTWINEYHLSAFGFATPEDMKQINRITSKVNATLRGLCDRRQLFVVDMQLAFGKFKGQIHVGDELSPFTCHFWDKSNAATSVADRFLPDQKDVVEAFSELRDRLKLKV